MALALLATAAPIILATAGPALSEGRAADAATQPGAAEPPSRPDARTEALLRSLAQAQATFKRHLPASADELTLAGEHAVRRIPVYFTEREAGRINAFRITATTAVSALPEASVLEVQLNRMNIGTLRPVAGGASSLTVDIDPGQVVPGFNELTLVATHQHRVDCSLEGTYELWTSIIPSETGFVGTMSDDGDLVVADLPAILGSNVAPTTLKVAAPARLDDDMATRIGRFVNATVLNGWMANPHIMPAEAASERAGVTLEVVPASPTERTGTSLRQFADSENLFVRTDATGRTVGLVLAGPPAALDRALDRLENTARARSGPGSEAGRAALVASLGRELDEAGFVTLAGLGMKDISFAGRRFHVDIPMLLPGDYYQADYGNLLLYLNGGYAANLLDTAGLVVKVNGVEAANVKLSGRGSDRRLQNLELRIPLRMFHAGKNTLTLEADLRTEADLSCAPENAAVMIPRFRLENSSRIVIPSMARVGVVPNLAATLSHGLPYALDAAPTDVFLVGDRGEALAAGLSLTGEITANSQRVMRFRFAFRTPSEDGSGFLVGAWRDMPGWARPLVGERVEDDAPQPDEDALEEAVAGAAPKAQEPGDPAPTVIAGRGDIVSDVVPLRQQQYFAASADAPALIWENAFDLAGEASAWLEEISFHSGASIRAQVEQIGDLLLAPGGDANRERLFVPDDVVLAQRAYTQDTGIARLSAAVLDREAPRIWTIVAADTGGAISAAVDGHAPAGVAFSPSGQHYVYSDSRDRTIEAGEAARLYATRPPDPANLRLVLAAWLSANAQVYLTVLLSALMAFAGLTYLTLRRRRDERAS